MSHYSRRAIRSLLLITSGILLAGCAGTAPKTSLYERLGGLPALTAVTNRTIDRSAAEPAIHRSFEGIKLPALKASIVQQLCQATGGPCKYEGEAMPKAHKGLAITPAEFDGMVAQLVDTLDEFKVGARENNELLQILGPMKSDMAGK